MNLKWLALLLIVAGLLALRRAFQMDPRTSFNDGTFIGEIALILGGLVSIGAGLVLFVALIFVAL